MTVRHLGAGQVEGDVMFLFAVGVSTTFTHPIHNGLMVSALRVFPIYFWLRQEAQEVTLSVCLSVRV